MLKKLQKHIPQFLAGSFSPAWWGWVLAGGLAMGLTPSPFEVWWLGWVALVPLWLAIRYQCRLVEKNSLLGGWRFWLRCSLLGGVWGIGFYGIALFWITGVHPLTWMGVPFFASLAIAIFCWVCITLWGTILAALWAGLLAVGESIFLWISPRPRSAMAATVWRVLLAVALWVSLENLWSQSPLWWSSLGYSQSPHNLPILHLAQISGPTMVTAAIAMVNGLLAEGIWEFRRGIAHLPAKQRYSLMVAPAIAFLGFHALGWSLYATPLQDSNGEAIQIGIVQGNIPNEIKLNSQGGRLALQGYTNGYRQLVEQGVDVVVTPETALPFLWTRSNRQNSSFQEAVKAEKVVAWLGTFFPKPSGYSNSLLTLTGDGQIYSHYDKVNLVPLGEYIPLENWLGGLISRLSPLEAKLKPGSPQQVFDTPFGKAIVGICYDSAFPKHFRRQTENGGKFIIIASNDAHYAASMPAQHHALDIMRAIESDRWMVRATNTGYSAFVDPHGRTLWISPLNQYATYQDTIYTRPTRTWYVRWGNWLLPVWWLLLLGSIFIWIVEGSIGRRNHGSH